MELQEQDQDFENGLKAKTQVSKTQVCFYGAKCSHNVLWAMYENIWDSGPICRGHIWYILQAVKMRRFIFDHNFCFSW